MGGWVKLSKAKATQRSEPAASQVREVALCYDRHPGLTADIWRLDPQNLRDCRAGDGQLSALQEGTWLIDFIDQEELLLRLLEKPEVTALLAGEIDLLLSNEFQDTSPIQLALFVRLAALARKAVWVGDVKQAIYGFRGCDPALMSAVVKTMEQDGRPVETLDTHGVPVRNWWIWSMPCFVPAFAGQLPAAQVQLKPHRSEVLEDSALEFWSLDGSNKLLRSTALAAGVRQLFTDKRQVVDRNTQQIRALRFRDVALSAGTTTMPPSMRDAVRPGSAGQPGARRAAGDARGAPDPCLPAAHGRCRRTLWPAPRSWPLAMPARRKAGSRSASRIWPTAATPGAGDWRGACSPCPCRPGAIKTRVTGSVPAEVLERVLLLGEVERTVVSGGRPPSPPVSD